MARTSVPRKMSLIVAMDLDGGIAKNGRIPWRLKQDMDFFKKITVSTFDQNKKNAVIMGRKCWESIPEKFRPLKDRLNIVVSRTMEPQRTEDLIVTNNFDEIVDELSSGELSKEIETVWNIGGTEVYRLALDRDMIDKLVVTKIDKRFESDLLLKVDWDAFSESENNEPQMFEENGTSFTIHTYNRIC